MTGIAGSELILLLLIGAMLLRTWTNYTSAAL